MKNFFFLSYLFFITLFCNSQNDSIDFYNKKLVSKINDTTRIDILNRLCKQYYLNDNASLVIPTAYKAVIIAQKINYEKGLCVAYQNIGSAYKIFGENKKALYYFLKAFEICFVLNDKKGIASILGNIGLIYESQDDYEKALNMFFYSLRICEEIDNKQGIADSYNAIGIIYSNISNYAKAIDYYSKSLKIKKELSDEAGIAHSLNNLAIVYMDQQKYDSAIHLHRESLKIGEKIKNNQLLALSYNNLGLCYRKTGKFESALFYHNRALKINEVLNNKKGIALVSYNLGVDFLNLNNYFKAVFYGNKALEISCEINNLYIKQSSYSLLANVYEKNQDFKKALYFERLSSQISDSIYNIDSQKNIEELNTKYETEKKEKKLAELTKEKKARELEITNQKSRNDLLLVSFLSAIAIIIMLISFLIIVKKTSNKLIQANRDVVSKNIEIERKKEVIISQSVKIAKYQSQMNPHFIFNAINGFQGMVLKDDKMKVLNHLQAFSKLLRLTLNNSENDYLTIQDEIDYLNKYIEFELHTFSNKFIFKINVNNEINLKSKIPTMLIQPIIENSIKHAGLENIDNGTIEVSFDLRKINDKHFIKITINDNGKGIENARTTHISKGINITKNRILLELNKNNFYFSDFFDIKSHFEKNDTLSGTEVIMIVPYINDKI